LENEEIANYPWTASHRGKSRSLVQGGRGLMQLEIAFVVDTTQVVDYVDSKKDLLIQIVRTHQHYINSTMLQRARRLKRKLQRGTRQIKDSTAE
jgi:hypothetical protein